MRKTDLYVIGGKKLILPPTTKDGENWVLDKSALPDIYDIHDFTNVIENAFAVYSENGIKNTIAHKNACKYVYQQYLKHLKADYISALVYPEKSKSVYAIAIWAVNDDTINALVADGLELAINKNGLWALRFRLNNSILKALAEKGAILKEYTPQQWNIITNAITNKYAKRGIEFENIGDLFECYYHELVGNGKPWEKSKARFDNECDVIDYKTFGSPIGAQCKAQKATICTLDTLMKIESEV